MSNWENPFKPEDFPNAFAMVGAGPGGILDLRKAVANNANARFRELLEEAPITYGIDFGHGDGIMWDGSRLAPTHTARLVDIRELK